MQPRVGVAVFVFKDGKFLMGERRGSHGEGTWSAPGGWIEYQETYQDAAVREVREETGVDIINPRFAGITNNIFTDNPIHSITIWVMGEWSAGEATITEPDKFVDQKWVDFDSLPEPLFLPWHGLLMSQFLPAIKAELAKS
jgi:8-oxo-dGTP diphosphatase